MENAEKNLKSTDDLLKNVFERLTLLRDKGRMEGIRTWYNHLDSLTLGMQASDLIAIAGRPGMGKTAFAINLASNVSIMHEGNVAIFSLEMPQEQLMQRILAARSKVALRKLYQPSLLTDSEFMDVCAAADAINNTHMYIDDKSDLSPLELRSKLQFMVEQDKKIDLVVIDYLQLMRSDRQRDIREQELTEISCSLKGIAKEFNIPVVVLVQLNQKFEERDDKQPRMPGLYELGALGIDADLVMFVHRNDAYAFRPEMNYSYVSNAQIIIGKQRKGPLGIVNLIFNRQCASFEEDSVD